MSKSYKLKDGNYIDSTGIVHNKQLLSEILEHQIITAVLKNNFNISETHIYKSIPFEEDTVVGNELTVSNGEVVIGEHIKHVKISFLTAWTITSAINEYKYAAFVKNGVQSYGLTRCGANHANSPFSLSQTERVISVNKGDKIGVQVYGTNGDVIDAYRTYFTVEKID